MGVSGSEIFFFFNGNANQGGKFSKNKGDKKCNFQSMEFAIFVRPVGVVLVTFILL